jgi:PAS domain S-box-containing protein
MKDKYKTKKELINELIELRERIAAFGEKGQNTPPPETAEKQQTRELLRRSEESFRALTENSQDIIMRFDIDYRHLYVNMCVEKITGIPAKNFIGKTHKELGFPHDLCEFWESAIKKVFTTGQTHRVEFELPNNIWIDWLLMPEFAQDGAVSYVITAARDITERKHMEEELKNQHKNLEQLVNERTANLQDEIDLRKKAELSLKKNEGILQERLRELEEFYDIAVGRELRMIELKQEIETLTEELAKYRTQ